jgi:hypothetical protein
MKKYDIYMENFVRGAMEEKNILRVGYGHPFIIILYSCFQTKVIFQIFEYVS